MNWRIWFGLVLLGPAWAQSGPPDRAILQVLRRAAPETKNAAVVRRMPADGGLDVVVALATAAPNNGFGALWWGTRDRLGLFLQSRADPNRVYRLAVAPGPNDDCSVSVERLTASELVLSCIGEKWATYDNQKFVFDARAKALVKQFSYAPFRAVATAGGRRFLMSNGRENLLAVASPDGAWELKPGPQDLPAAAEAPFGPGGRFQLAAEKNRFGSDFPVIVEGTGSSRRVYRLPQSSEKAWREARPDDAANGAALNPDEMNEQIGPHQAEDGRLWFGKTFYNSEGLSGVGGFGYFDFASLRFRLYAPPEIRRWSVSAILVEPGMIWMGLYRRGEYGDAAGGLLAWDRRGGQARHYPAKSIIMAIVRQGESLQLGATNGLLVLKDGRVASYFVDRTLSGQYRVVER